MRVVHMDSGLGNQMLDYAEYIAIRHVNSDGEMYLETAIYDIKSDHDGMISQWNGYELQRIFGIDVPMLKDKVGTAAWNRIVMKTEQSRFWEQHWNYAPVITKAINDEGYELKNLQKNSSPNVVEEHLYKEHWWRRSITSFFRTYPGYMLKCGIKRAFQNNLISSENSKFDVFQIYPDNSFIGHSLELKYKGFEIERIDEEVRKAFRFGEIHDEKNKKALDDIRSCNSVAVHARRSDMLSVNWYCYKYGYFKRAVRYIKKHVDNPVFFFFCDEESRMWCQKNNDVFGLNEIRDNIQYITWNSGTESYRDMQLMSECKHNIFTESSFGFWGAYLNNNPDKITCAPDPMIIATNWF